MLACFTYFYTGGGKTGFNVRGARGQMSVKHLSFCLHLCVQLHPQTSQPVEMLQDCCYCTVDVYRASDLSPVETTHQTPDNSDPSLYEPTQKVMLFL